MERRQPRWYRRSGRAGYRIAGVAMTLNRRIREIVVAVRDLPAGHAVRAEDLTRIEVESELLGHAGTVRDEAVVGCTLVERAFALEPLRRERLDGGCNDAAACDAAVLPLAGPPSPEAVGKGMAFFVARTVEVGAVLTRADVFLVPGLTRARLPGGALSDPRRVIGRVVAARMYEGELVRSERLVPG